MLRGVGEDRPVDLHLACVPRDTTVTDREREMRRRRRRRRRRIPSPARGSERA
jgi:hypothetical protein